jgi:thiamine-phosphate pyrophosphorylase
VERLLRTARTLGRGLPQGKSWRQAKRALPRLWLVTDPARLADPVAAAERLPRGAGVIYRAFGAPDALTTALALRAVARRRGLALLIGADEGLAEATGADGVHLPERLLHLARGIRARHRTWIVTGAAHSGLALRRAERSGCDAVLLSPVFLSRSGSAGRPLGATRFAGLVRQTAIPVIALGGVTNETAPGPVRAGAYGLAAVDGLSP